MAGAALYTLSASSRPSQTAAAAFRISGSEIQAVDHAEFFPGRHFSQCFEINLLGFGACVPHYLIGSADSAQRFFGGALEASQGFQGFFSGRGREGGGVEQDFEPGGQFAAVGGQEAAARGQQGLARR
ncbi:MAG: hypothetical protein FD154_1011 [Elusimicrobia bacterium]|nr:MAG: hypothetical protein FD154_1011 [Elusimicrobiota bacterium]